LSRHNPYDFFRLVITPVVEKSHEDGVSEGLPVRHIEAFLEQLRAAQYAEETLRKKPMDLDRFRAMDEEQKHHLSSP
jgi:hypothetical protein